MCFYQKYKKIVFCLIILLLPLLHFNEGISLGDTGYTLSNCLNFPNVQKTWMLSTLLSLLGGRLLTFLPWGSTLAGFSFYNCLLLGLCLTALFLMLSGRLTRGKFSTELLFLGMVAAICLSWCPKTITYHYFSYLLFTFGAVTLVFGLADNRYRLMALSGILLSLNIFVRFPNITELSLGLVILFSWIPRKKADWKALLAFLLPYVAVFLAGYVIISLFWGQSAYRDMISGLFSMTETATSYTPFHMLASLFEGYTEQLRVFLAFGISALVFFGLSRLFQKTWVRILLLAGDVVVFLGILRVLHYYGRFSFHYGETGSIYLFAVLFLMLSIVCYAITVFDRRAPFLLRLLSLTCILVIFITPLGSNNGLYTIINSLYLVAPVTLILLFGRMEYPTRMNCLEVSSLLLSLALLFQSVFFYGEYRFQDSNRSDYITVTAIPSLKGMKGNSATVSQLESLYAFLTEENLGDTRTIVFGNIPSVLYYCGLNNAILHIWPDLPSYPEEEFSGELSNLTDHVLVIYDVRNCEDLLSTAPESLLRKKDRILAEYLQSEGYVEIFRNDYFRVLM